MQPTPHPLLVSFLAGATGAWKIDSLTSPTDTSLPLAERLQVIEGTEVATPEGNCWLLRGTTGNLRYTKQAELNRLASKQEGLGRPEATRAALIPIRKSEAWWSLAQDRRRAILEEQSHHIAIGLAYLPAIARRLHHSRELGEPFDFLTWFEYAPQHTELFDQLVTRLRATREWKYVDSEVDIRLSRPPA